MARTTSRHRCTPSRPCYTNRKVAAIFQRYYSGGGAPAFTPLDFPEGLQAYHNVLELSTAYNNNDQVTLVDDLSESGKTLTNPGQGTGPLWQADHGDGYPALDCSDGARGFVCEAGKADWNFMHSGPSTSMYLVKSLVDNENHVLFATISGVAQGVGRYDYFRQFSADAGGRNGSFSSRIRNDTTGVVHCIVPEQKAQKDAWLLIWVVVDNDLCTIWVNGVPVEQAAIANAFSSSDSTQLPRMFVAIGGSDDRFTGYYRASAFWNRALDVDTIAKISGGVNFGL